VQKRFCKTTDVVVLIVERREEFSVRGEVLVGAPLQVTSKYVQGVAMSDFLRHVSQVKSVCRRLVQQKGPFQQTY
jgi:hypothetical protein